MKNLRTYLFLFILAIVTQAIHAQSCLPNGINFTMQTEVDNFPNSHPGCTIIQGPVTISGSSIDIFNMSGLSQVTSMGGLEISETYSLKSLTGLEGLEAILGDLTITGNVNLKSISSLSGIQIIEGKLSVGDNDSLQNFTGLQQIQVVDGLILEKNRFENLLAFQGIVTIDGELRIKNNPNLQNLDGLTNLTSVNGSLLIEKNQNLTNLDGLSNLGSAGLGIKIIKNNQLISISGLSNIDPLSVHGELGYAFVEDFVVKDNISLQQCNIDLVCGLFQTAGIHLSIYGNATGCTTTEEVYLQCQPNSPCTFYTLVLHSQAEIDNFSTDYPGCVNLPGNLVIEPSFLIPNNSITNLSGLSSIQSINDDLRIWRGDMIDMSGFSALNNIWGKLTIRDCNELTSFNGLEMAEVHGGVYIFRNNKLTTTSGLKLAPVMKSHVVIENNAQLQNINGFHSVQKINGHLEVVDNPKLEYLATLTQLTNVGSDLIIEDNHDLRTLVHLGSLQEIGGGLTIDNNYSLKNLNGLTGISTLKYLKVKYNFHLKSLSGLNNLELLNFGIYQYWSAALTIESNQSLTSLTGLDGLKFVRGAIFIRSNQSLEDFDALSSVVSCNGVLSIRNNNTLTSIQGLQNMSPVDITMPHWSLHISGNDNLGMCAVSSICEILNLPNTVATVENNAPGCNSESEIDCDMSISFSCPDDITATLPTSEMTMPISWSAISGTTSCANGNVYVEQTAGPLAGSEFGVGSYVITYTFTDGCSNVETCSFTITVNASTATNCGDITGFTKLGELNGHGYYLSDASVPWSQAKILTENAGGYLATMNDQAENDFLKSNLGNTMAFIGYNDAATEGTGQWATPESVTLDLSYSNSEDNDYAVMNFWAGTWQLVSQWVYKPFVMEMDCGGSTGTDLPDLAISNISNFPASGLPNTQVDFNFDLNNIGTTTATGSYVIGMYLSTDSSFSNDDVLVGEVPTGSTPVGTIANVPAAITIPGNMADGNYFMIVIADNGNTILELDESNNIASVSFSIGSGVGGGCAATITGFTKLGEHNGHGYYLSDASTNWNQAKTLAENAGGYLATMNDQAENDFVKSNLGNNMVFIGYNDATTEGIGQWATTESITLDLSYSNSIENDYAVMNFWAGTWQMVNEFVAKRFVMEMNCGSPQPTPAPLNTMVLVDTKIHDVYPNPAMDNITLRVISEEEKDATFNIYDARGQRLLSENRFLPQGASKVDFDLSELPAGMYFVKEAGGKKYYNFVIMR